MSDVFSTNNEGCKIAELDEIAMILMGISDNMFSSRTYLNTMCKYFLVLGDKSVHFSDTIYT